MSDFGLIDVRENHRFDEESLETFLEENLEGYAKGAQIQQFAGGQSNPTFLLTSRAGKFVVRKKPPGELLPSAHQVEREYRLYRALAETGVPVPRVHLLCEDSAVIGTPFYVMQYVEGRVLPDPQLNGISPMDRRAIYLETIRVLARLHSLDHQTIGLGDYGRSGNYFVRQTGRWTKQYLAAQTDDIPAMTRLMSWLDENVPEDDTTSIVHGDYQLYNLVFHQTEPRCVAVLDWELSTLGHPLADLAYTCMKYHSGELGQELPAGIPPEKELVEEYCRQTGRPRIDHWNFCLAFSFFRLASIIQGVYKRGLQGNASSASALDMKHRVADCAEIAWRIATS